MALTANISPDFIQFLFSSKPKFDCYFKVGNKSQEKPEERIGAVKLMLMAHSEVFRLELEDSDLKEKQDVPIKDIDSDTFRGMLKYVYGHDTTTTMEFDEADNLFYVAEKYMMKTLKNKLAVRLMELLNPDNICSLLNNPACHTHLELDSAITQILRYETDRVLDSPQFVWMNADGFLQILQQDGLVVPEIELWRASIKWAKHKANSEDGQMLRQELSSVMPQLRLCTLTANEFSTEVATTDVLTTVEIGTVCQAIAKKEKPQDLGSLSNEINPRKILQRNESVQAKDILTLNLILNKTNYWDRWEYNLTLLPKKDTIELLPLVCRSQDRDSRTPEHWTYKVEGTTTISKVTNPNNPTSSSVNEPPITVTSSQDVKYGVEFEVPLSVDGRNITLLPDTKYAVKIVLNGSHKLYYSKESSRGSYGNDHLEVAITPTTYAEYCFPSTKFQYRAYTSGV